MIPSAERFRPFEDLSKTINLAQVGRKDNSCLRVPFKDQRVGFVDLERWRAAVFAVDPIKSLTGKNLAALEAAVPNMSDARARIVQLITHVTLEGTMEERRRY